MRCVIPILVLCLTFAAATARACIAKLLVHEFSHTCGFDEAYADYLDTTAYQWLRERFSSGSEPSQQAGGQLQCGTT